MHLHDQLRALRSDDTPQRDAQKRMVSARDSWLELPDVAEVLADMDAFGTSRPLAECPALAALFEEESVSAQSAAQAFIGQLTSISGRALVADPLGYIALRHFTDGTISTLMLARRGRVSLTLMAVDGAGLKRRPAPPSVSFSANEQWDHVLAGSARADLITCRDKTADGITLHKRSIALTPGRVLPRDCRMTAMQLREVDGCLVTLRLQRSQLKAEPTREYDLESGALIHQAASNARDSRFELMLSLLGRMGRADSAPIMAAIALEQGGDSLRWQALRECLGLDTLTGFRTLSALAQRADDPLAGAADTLRTQLVQAHPQLAEIV